MKIVTPLLLVAGLALAGAAHAETLTLEPVDNPLDPAIERVTLDGRSPFEVRSLSISAANDLLASTEGPAWRVLAVQAPACGTKSKNKDAKKNCKALKAECGKATRYAKAYKKHAACSALYKQTAILLTNDGSQTAKVVAEKSTRQVSKYKPKKKSTRKVVRPVRKPAAVSCEK